jgi:transcriptional regulator GlxA family with amidase domain
VLLAASGLLNGKAATSHWGCVNLFRRSFPEVRSIPEPNIVFADHTERIVAAGRGISTPSMIATRKSAATSPTKWPCSAASLND